MWLIITFQLLAFFLLMVILLGCLYTFWLTIFYPPFVPTVNNKVSDTINDYLNQNPDITLFCEPGAGFANVADAVSKKNPKLEVIAIEYNFFIFVLAKITLFVSRSKVKMIWANFLKFNLDDYKKDRKTLIYCYLLPELMDKANEMGKFKKSTVLSLDFKISGEEPQNQLIIGSTGFQKQVWRYEFK